MKRRRAGQEQLFDFQKDSRDLSDFPRSALAALVNGRRGLVVPGPAFILHNSYLIILP
jgi:hypothetical protein